MSTWVWKLIDAQLSWFQPTALHDSIGLSALALLSWFQPTALHDPIGPSAAWRYLHIRASQHVFLFIAIIPCIPEYKAFSIIPFPDIIIAIRFGTWSPLSRSRPYLRMSACGGHHDVGLWRTEAYMTTAATNAPYRNVSLRQWQRWLRYDLFAEQVGPEVSLLQWQREQWACYKAVKYEQHRYGILHYLYLRVPETAKRIATEPVPWHNECMTHGWKAGRLYAQRRSHGTKSAWTHGWKAGWLIGFATLRSTGYWAWDVWTMMIAVSSDKGNDVAAEKNLEMRVYRSVYLFRFSVKKDDCDKEGYGGSAMRTWRCEGGGSVMVPAHSPTWLDWA